MAEPEPTETASGIAGRRDAMPDRSEIAAHHLTPESALVAAILDRTGYSRDERRRIGEIASRLVEATRSQHARRGGIDAFLREYGLSSEEGVILMCLAEALLRIPDAETADQLIAEKIGGGRWQEHLGASDSFLVNASTFGLLLTGQVVRFGQDAGSGPVSVIRRLIGRSGEPVVRQAVRQAMRILGDQFVLGRTIEEALKRAAPLERQGVRFSYDMLGEGARTARDAERYFARYVAAAEAVGRAAGPAGEMSPEALMRRPGLSVKLSALSPRFEPGKEARIGREVVPRVTELARIARARGLSLTIDAEEQDRLDLTLDVFAACYLDASLAGWPGLGLAVQAYGKRALPVLRWLEQLARSGGRRIPVRLVKGAYWDSEIKWAQERGLAEYPVFTEKRHTDLSYMSAMRVLLSGTEAFYPQIATHNAHTVAAAAIAGANVAFEYQRLHGMGEALYDEAAAMPALARPCRVYAPVGGHEDLLAYLVRRLLENGANTSFVNRLADSTVPVADIVRDPIEAVGNAGAMPGLVRPPELFGAERRNSEGLALAERTVRASLHADINRHIAEGFAARPIVSGRFGAPLAAPQAVTCPHDRRLSIGTVIEATERDIEAALAGAARAVPAWDRLGGDARAEALERASDLLERNRARLLAAIIREAGKTLEAAHAEVREAVDFLRYYAREARRHFAASIVLPGPTGERNTLALRARGVVACISPWNFPLAIFTGQVAAALAAGNAVVAKPAEQTPISAFLAVELLHSAGVPVEILQLLPGDGRIGAALVRDPRVAAVAFTGSNETAARIQAALVARGGPIVPFIAETGGINAMIADSSALPEQIVRDAVRSAFDSAGQRCSAARLLFIQSDIADRTLEMLAGAVEALDLGDPLDYATDIGPVIDQAAQDDLEAHKVRMLRTARRIVDLALPETCRHGTYVTPAVFEIDRPGALAREVFGPILHVVRFDGGHLDKVIESINAMGYGLTLGLHSRIAAVADYVEEHARVGNLYVNRNQIGAVVGVQPFGGEGLSGTGPKAGGPHYMIRLATERVRSTDITATGGNVELLGGRR